MKYVPRLPDTSVNYSQESPVRELVRLVTALAVIVVSVFLILGWAVERTIPHVSPEVEKNLGKLYLRSMVIVDSTDARLPYLQNLTDRLTPPDADLPFRLRVYIVAKPQVNAVALPGGSIVIFEGLLDEVESENELAFILGHEIGHFVQKDHLRALGRSLVMLTVSAALFGTDSQLNNVLSQSMQLSQFRHSRQQESGADRIGLRSLYRHYSHVGGATDFFMRLQDDAPYSRYQSFIATHPGHLQRIEAILDMAATNGWQVRELQKLPEDF